MASALAPPVQVVASGAPPFVHVPSGAPPFVKVAGNAPPIMLVDSGAPPITLLNEDGSIWSAHTPAGGEVLLVDETDGFATDFTHPVDGERVAVKTAGTVVSSGTSFFTSSGTSSKWVYDSAGTLVNIPVGTLPLDYDPVTHVAKGLLCEPAATNLHPWSQNISNMIWDGGTPTLDNQAGPDAALTADTYTEDTASGTHSAYGPVPTVASTDYTHSRYMKMGTRRYATLCLGDGTNGAYAVYDLQSGVVGSSAIRGTGVLNYASMQACPNGWYRCILSTKNPSTTTYYIVATANAASYTPSDGHGRQSFTGTGSTLFLGHAQVEAGTVATSPIPTAAATATRAGDRFWINSSSINYSPTAGSWWAEHYTFPNQVSQWVIGSNAADAPIFSNGDHYYGMISNSAPIYKTIGSGATGTISRVMCAFQAGDRAITAKGQAVEVDTGATAGVLGLSEIWFGYGAAGGIHMHGYLRQVRYLPRRPSNAELVTMTT